jgi:hypothetical protein
MASEKLMFGKVDSLMNWKNLIIPSSILVSTPLVISN